MKARRVVVTIDEVRLHGFDPLRRSAFGDALTRELTRRLSQERSAPAASDVRRAVADSVMRAVKTR